MSSGDLIPDRRRKHFPRNGGPRPTASDKRRGRQGIAAARAKLAATTPAAPNSSPSVVRRLTPEQIVRARQGITAARTALSESARSKDPTPSSEAA